MRPLARVAQRPCARPGCPAPARATLTFSYATAEAVLDRLAADADPQGYDLCVAHAGRTDPPRGWKLTDQRPEDERDEPVAALPASPSLGDEATVAVLAAALRAVPTDLEDVAATPEPVAVAAATEPADPSAEPTVELPRLRTPRPVPAAEERSVLPRLPATDW